MNYDVFISCKSEDYIYAEGIYKYLKDNGIKVFLASTELRRLGEAEYRKAISNALKGAYHMIVFASKAEYVDSRWVYYEWDMFVNAKLKGYKPGNIVTILKDIALDDINMDLWKYESMMLDDYQDRIIPYVETAESKARMQELENQRQKEAEKQQLEQAKIEKQIKLKRELVGLAEDYKKKLTNLSVDIAKIKDKRREAENITYRCPVCSEESSISDEYCNNCGWVFSPIEGIEGAEYLTKDRNPLVERMREIRARKTDDSKQIKSLNTQIDNLKQELSTSRRDNGELSKQVVHLSDELSKLRKSQQSGQNQGGDTQSSSSFSLKNLFSWLKSNSLALIIIAISAVTFILLDEYASPEDFDCTAIYSEASDCVDSVDLHAYRLFADIAVFADSITDAELRQLIDGMVKVEGGTFTMGATSEQGSDAFSDEKPTHQVTLSDYMIGKTEVTQEQWEAVMGSNPSYYKGTNLPVEQVSWNECQEFIEKLNILTGLNFRLPTEAEWEYAARGGAKSCGYKYSGSNDIAAVAWNTNTTNDAGTMPVATKAPNELGLYDMSGNVYEWCSDWYGDYSAKHQTNPYGSSIGSGRVTRGGSWADDDGGCRVSYRRYINPAISYCNFGLRLAL